MLVEVGQSGADAFEVGGFDLVERHTAVHLQTLCRGHQNREVGLQSALAAFDVEKLFSTQIRAKSGFGDGVFGVGERHFGGKQRVAAVGNVGKGAAVHKRSRIFGGLYEVGLERIFEQHHDRTCHTEVADGERSAVVAIAEHDLLNAAAQVVFVGGEAENSHQFGSGSDVKPRLCFDAVGGRPQTGDDAAQRAVIHVEDAAPQDFLQAKSLGAVLIQVVVEQRGNHVVRRGDGVEVAREVEVDFLHRQHLSMAAAGRTALHAEARPERGFAQGHHGFFADVVETECQTDGHGGLTDTGAGGGDGSDQNEV